MIWNSSFEAYPSGSDFASVTARAIREFKTTFREYISAEHTFDESVNPVMTHNSGFCSVVKEVPELEYPLVNGAIQIAEEGRAIRINNIGTPITFGTFDHNWFYGGGLADSHTQYLKLAEDRNIDFIQAGQIKGLSSAFSAVKDNNKVISQGEHGIGGEAKHKDSCITDLHSYLSGQKVPFRAINMNEDTVSIIGNGDYDIPASSSDMFMPSALADAYWTLNPNNDTDLYYKVRVVNFVESFTMMGRYIVD